MNHPNWTGMPRQTRWGETICQSIENLAETWRRIRNKQFESETERPRACSPSPTHHHACHLFVRRNPFVVPVRPTMINLCKGIRALQSGQLDLARRRSAVSRWSLLEVCRALRGVIYERAPRGKGDAKTVGPKNYKVVMAHDSFCWVQ